MTKTTIYLPDDLQAEIEDSLNEDDSLSGFLRRAARRELNRPDRLDTLEDRLNDHEQRLRQIEEGKMVGRIGVGRVGFEVPIESLTGEEST